MTPEQAELMLQKLDAINNRLDTVNSSVQSVSQSVYGTTAVSSQGVDYLASGLYIFGILFCAWVAWLIYKKWIQGLLNRIIGHFW